jgi:hypothetical protein
VLLNFRQACSRVYNTTTSNYNISKHKSVKCNDAVLPTPLSACTCCSLFSCCGTACAACWAQDSCKVLYRWGSFIYMRSYRTGNHEKHIVCAHVSHIVRTLSSTTARTTTIQYADGVPTCVWEAFSTTDGASHFQNPHTSGAAVQI